MTYGILAHQFQVLLVAMKSCIVNSTVAFRVDHGRVCAIVQQMLQTTARKVEIDDQRQCTEMGRKGCKKVIVGRTNSQVRLLCPILFILMASRKMSVHSVQLDNMHPSFIHELGV